jgi:N-acetylmuramic acid 6-phosphate etherase
MLNLSRLATEQRNDRTTHIDHVSTLEMVRMMNEEDSHVAIAVQQILPDIARAIDVITARLKKGGRLFYMGSGTSGRLGVLDAAECPPTFSTAPELVQGLIAGGQAAMFTAQEGAEDSEYLGQRDLENKRLAACDVVVALSASGRTPYAIGGQCRCCHHCPRLLAPLPSGQLCRHRPLCPAGAGNHYRLYAP